MAEWGRDCTFSCFGKLDVPAIFPAHPLGHSHDYVQTLPFKKWMGMVVLYEKTLEILPTVNIYIFLNSMIRITMVLCDLCTNLLSLTQVIKALGKSLLCFLSPTPRPDLPVKPTA